MTLLTIALFVITSAAIVWTWNRLFRPVPLRVALVLWLFCAAYQATTLFTPRVDLPGNLAFVAYPWQATGGAAVKANTGILFTQIAPWTRIARDALLSGNAPLWNRMSAGGAPLLANQQTAIFHPLALLGILLPLGKAFTLSASLRLFLIAFFTFLLLCNWEITDGAAIFGAVAYTFCSFHIVWLLFPLGLSTMMLPICLVGVQELARDPRGRSYAVLLAGLSLAVLGGHPESALWVWIVTMLFAIATYGNGKRLALMASAFIMAMLLTAFFWMPALRALRETPRFQSVQSRDANPADHGLSYEWLLPLITPNVLGTPANGTYTPPRGQHAAVLNDYGEVASSYAGLATLALALAAPFAAARRRPLAIAICLMLFSLITFAEAPVWRDLVRAIPFAGISIHQRLRIFWDLGVCIAAALTIDAAMRGESRRRIAIAFALVMAAFIAIYAIRNPAFLRDPIGLAQFLVPLATSILIVVSLRWKRVLIAATLLVFADLAVATYRYNPPSKPADVYPITGAIATLQRGAKPFRFAAWGWSFLPDTPGYYGIEDIKTTDPIQNAHYMRLMRGYLNADPASYDQVLRSASQPFFDYLNIQYIYVPPDQSLTDRRFVEVYRGTDGTILKNTRALPRYFFVEHFRVEPSFDRALGLSKQIRDFRVDAIVDHVPAKVLARELGGGTVSIHRYAANETALDITSNGWNLLVSSDVNWPGWRAYWNGHRQPPVIVNGAFLGCFIPPGRGQLLFRYRPDEFTRGLQLSALAALLLTAVAIARKVRKLIAILAALFPTIPPPAQRLLVFARLPERGRVKTRLAESIGDDAALAAYETMLRDLLASIGRPSFDTEIEILWAPTEIANGASLTAAFDDLPTAMQTGATLGDRLSMAFSERFFFHATQKIVAIGVDDPSLPRTLIDHALALLDSCEWVLGPAEDGGYYLIGCRAPAFDPAIFQDIAWGTSSVFATTISKIAEWQSTVAVLPVRWDIDDVADWERYQAPLSS